MKRGISPSYNEQRYGSAFQTDQAKQKKKGNEAVEHCFETAQKSGPVLSWSKPYSHFPWSHWRSQEVAVIEHLNTVVSSDVIDRQHGNDSNGSKDRGFP